MAPADEPTVILAPPAFPPQLTARRRVPITPSKVPQRITAHFWVIKVLSTAMGEATSDFLVHRMNPVVGVLIGLAVFVVAMAMQLSTPYYVAARYWFAVAMVAVFGTMCADVVHVVLGVPYILSSLFYLAVLVTVFTAWYRSEGTLSIHSITNRRRELFYWATVLITFAMGTAIGDLTAIAFHLGFLASGVMFLALFAVPGIAYRYTAVSPVAAFWVAYVLTRPLGASFADWFDFPRSAGGLGIGRLLVAAALTVPIVVLVRHVGRSGVDRLPRSQGKQPFTVLP